jgi:hypothetical protein
MYTNLIMSYVTFSSEQITTKSGELSIDVFSDINKPDNSKLTLNCNSNQVDGILLNCINGGIRHNSDNFTINSTKYKLQSKNIGIEAVNKINLYSLDEINITALNSISLLNDKDGFIYDINNNLLKLSNNQEGSKMILESDDIKIGNNHSNINIIGKKINYDFEDTFTLKKNNEVIFNINSNKSIELYGDVYIRGTLKFDKISKRKVTSIKVKDLKNKLIFGTENDTINDWDILGYHLNGISNINFNPNNKTFSFLSDNNLANIKIGGLSVTNNNRKIFFIDEDDVTNAINFKSNSIITNDIEIKNKLKCRNLEINGKKIIEHIGNIVSNNDDNLQTKIIEENYILLNCNIEQNIFMDIDEFNLQGYYKNITWVGKISFRNTKNTSYFKNIIFKNTNINLINCSCVIFENCEIQNTNITCNINNLIFRECSFDVNSVLKTNHVHLNTNNIECNIIVSDSIVINLCKLNYSNINKIIFENASVTFHITNNFIRCNNIENMIISSKDVLLVDNWITNVVNNTCVYEKNTIIKQNK